MARDYTYNTEWLLKQENLTKDDYILFWGSYLSQWHPAAFHFDFEVLTAEHWMMHEKALLFKDFYTANKIREAIHPSLAKKLGREVKNYNEEKWNEYRYDTVILGNISKFEANYELKRQLLNTGDKIIVEASPHDKIWGIGLGESNEKCYDPNKWEGL